MRHNNPRSVRRKTLILLLIPLVAAVLLAAHVSLMRAHSQNVIRTVVAEVNTSNAGAHDFAFASLNDIGNRITFYSYRDWAGENSGGETRLFAYEATTDSFTQHNNENFGIWEMTVSGDGMLVAFAASLDLVGTNADGSIEIFLYDVISDTVAQITDSPLGGRAIFSRAPVISADGSQIAFLSSDNPTGGNPGASTQIFLNDVAGGAFSQITNASGDASNPSTWVVPGALSGDGKRLTFSAPADLTGGNPDGGHEIFLYDTTTVSMTQVTNSSASATSFFVIGFGRPPMNADGTRIVYISHEDPTGANPDGGRELFLYDSTTLSTTQVTDIPASGGRVQSTQISGNGTRISLNSTADLTGGNPDGNMEFFRYEVATGTFTQLTDTLLDTANISSEDLLWNGINYDGTRLIASRVLEGWFFNNSSTLEYFEFEDHKLYLPLVISS